MPSAVGERVRDQRPLVLVICATPLLREAVDGALDGLAQVQRIPAASTDLDQLVDWFDPDALVVDDAVDETRAAARFGREGCPPLLHVSLAEPTIRLYVGGGWVKTGETSEEQLRNVLLGMISARRVRSG
jgi:hypothetical protein